MHERMVGPSYSVVSLAGMLTQQQFFHRLHLPVIVSRYCARAMSEYYRSTTLSMSCAWNNLTKFEADRLQLFFSIVVSKDIARVGLMLQAINL